MLQQTQVKTVVPYFEKFFDRFPDVRTLAGAGEQEVLAAWSGLGYYRRAKALHRGASLIVQERNGLLPDTFEEWLTLPGIGRYTAGAIMSIAYGERYAILDGNVTRVLTRLFLIRGNPKQSKVNKRLWRKAEAILPRRSISEFNQALMELGALVCTTRNPRCLVCPLEQECKARGKGLEQEPAGAPISQSCGAGSDGRRGCPTQGTNSPLPSAERGLDAGSLGVAWRNLSAGRRAQIGARAGSQGTIRPGFEPNQGSGQGQAQHHESQDHSSRI